MDKHPKINLQLKIWYEVQDEGEKISLFGEKKFELLKNIRNLGSINSAADKLGIDFKKAHDMIDDMNSKVHPEKLIISQRGRGKGSELTLFGEDLLTKYSQAMEKLNHCLEKLNENPSFQIQTNRKLDFLTD